MAVKGYARVSSETQNLDRQLKQLKDYGCDVIYKEKVSGKDTNRSELQKMINNLEEGDIVVVSDLTRITRSTQDLFKLMEFVKEKGSCIKSIKDTWLDTTSDNPYSQFLLTVMAGVNQLERDLIKQRQKEGIEVAKEKGKYKGRVKKYAENHKGMQHAIELYKDGSKTVKEICQITQVSRSTLYRKIKEVGA